MNDQNLKTVDIKGKPYVEVNERIRYFRENYQDHKLLTEIISLDNGVCVMKAYVLNPEGQEIANGHAYEKEGAGFINKTSYIENCETSAWGRALGNLGIGITTSIASSNEVENAILQQNNIKDKKVKTSLGTMTEEEIFKKATQEGLSNLVKSLEKAPNIAYKDTVIQNVCEIVRVKKWNDIEFKGNLTYDKLTDIVKQELQKEKDLAQAGI